jgi:hypothetical protein
MGDIVVDDHLLVRLLCHREPAGLRPTGGSVWTTGLWYHRLCRAVADDTVNGVLSAALGDTGLAVAARTAQATIDLPESIGLVSLRSLAWPMADLISNGVRLNLMSLEALAVAEQLGAEICLAAADDNRPLLDAARQRGVKIRFVEV